MADEYSEAVLDDVTIAVRDLIGASRELLGRMAHTVGRNVNDMAAVGMLIQFGPMGARELADRLAITTASATTLIDRLERDGHAVRVRDTVDRRRVVVSETEAARHDNLAAWWPLIREIDRECRSLDHDDRAVVLDLLRRIVTTIDRGGRPTGSGGHP